MNGVPNNRDAQRVLRLVADIGGLEEWMMREAYRSQKALVLRQVAGFMLHNDLGYSLPETARLLGWRSHSSAARAVANMRLGRSQWACAVLDRVRVELASQRASEKKLQPAKNPA